MRRSKKHLSVDQTLDTLDASHMYTDGGIFTITVTVVDSDGAASDPVTTSAVTQGVGIVAGVLYVIGTDDRDKVRSEGLARPPSRSSRSVGGTAQRKY